MNLISVLLQTEPDAWLDYIERGGVLGGALILIWALITERMVPGVRYRRAIEEEKQRSEEWRRLFEQSALPLAEKAVEVAKSRRR